MKLTQQLYRGQLRLIAFTTVSMNLIRILTAIKWLKLTLIIPIALLILQQTSSIITLKWLGSLRKRPQYLLTFMAFKIGQLSMEIRGVGSIMQGTEELAFSLRVQTDIIQCLTNHCFFWGICYQTAKNIKISKSTAIKIASLRDSVSITIMQCVQLYSMWWKAWQDSTFSMTPLPKPIFLQESIMFTSSSTIIT